MALAGHAPGLGGLAQGAAVCVEVGPGPAVTVFAPVQFVGSARSVWVEVLVAGTGGRVGVVSAAMLAGPVLATGFEAVFRAEADAGLPFVVVRRPLTNPPDLSIPNFP